MKYFPWNEEHEAFLRKIAALGLSFTEMCNAMQEHTRHQYQITRNSIAGKCFRMGIYTDRRKPVKNLKIIGIKKCVSGKAKVTA